MELFFNLSKASIEQIVIFLHNFKRSLALWGLPSGSGENFGNTWEIAKITSFATCVIQFNW
jgi:hypothetical protein